MPKQPQAKELRSTVVTTSLGLVGLVAHGEALCALEFADTKAALQAQLAQRFPKSTLHADAAGLASLAQAVVTALEHPDTAHTLALAPQGTDFQKAVWGELAKIPRGATRTYGQIAAALGRPKAARAVGQAIGANPLAVVVPCHRVVGAAGQLTGYRWGLVRKQALLAREGAAHGC